MDKQNYGTVDSEPKNIIKTDSTNSIDTIVSLDSTEDFCNITFTQNEKKKNFKNSIDTDHLHNDNESVKSTESIESTESNGYYMLCVIS